MNFYRNLLLPIQIYLNYIIKNWRNALVNNLYKEAVLMDLSKAFDCFPHDFLIAQLQAYSLGVDNLTFLYRARAQSLAVSDLRSETKGSRFESGC